MRHNVHLGITGLRRTGKTAFLTSLIHQLHENGSTNLSCFNANAVKLRPAPQLQDPRDSELKRFPYERVLAGLREDRPYWPPPTSCEFGLTLRFYYENLSKKAKVVDIRRLVGLGQSHGTIILHLHDYPGEYLLDVGMIGKSFEEWSKATLLRMESQLPSEADRYKKNVEQIQARASEDTKESLPSFREAYAHYAQAARQVGFEFVQPAMTLIEWYERNERCGRGDERWDVPSEEELPFIPLPELPPAAPRLVGEMNLRYKKYLEDNIKPFYKRIQRCDTQLVLVDVLRILKHGVDAFNDTRDCITEILQAYHGSWRPLRRVKRVLFAATKADHALKSNRSNMTKLLDDLVGKAKGTVSGNIPIQPAEWFTSIRATKDGTTKRDGRPLGVLVGRKIGEIDEKSRNPGIVPDEWPDDAGWRFGNKEFDFPEFEPSRLSKLNSKPWPHLNLDQVIWRILQDCF